MKSILSWLACKLALLARGQLDEKHSLYVAHVMKKVVPKPTLCRYCNGYCNSSCECGIYKWLMEERK